MKKTLLGAAVILSAFMSLLPARAGLLRPLSCSPDGTKILFALGGKNDRGYVYDLGNRNWVEIEAVVGCLAESWRDGSHLGVKVVDKDTLSQYPAAVDLSKGTLNPLKSFAPTVGFPVFSKGCTLFPFNKVITCLNGKRGETTLAGMRVWSHYAPVSPDGRHIASTDRGGLKVWNFNGSLKFASPGSEGIPFWSPDGKRIALGDGNIRIFNLAGKKIEVGEVAKSEAGPFYSNPRWLPDGSGIVFISWIVNNGEVFSELVKVDPGGREKWSIPLEEEIVSDPLPLPGNRVLLAGEGGAGLYRMEINGLYPVETLYPVTVDEEILPPPDAPSEAVKAVVVEGVPYIHQKYDTPDWCEGGNMCGPSSCVMVAQRYKVFPYWPTLGDYGVSPWGNYIPGLFKHNGFVYDKETNDSNGLPARGAHGFMHTSQGAGWQQMEDFLQNQDLETDYTTYPGFETYAEFIDRDAPCVLSTNLTSSGHIIVGIGYYENGSIVARDPYGDKNDGYPNHDDEAIYDWPTCNNGYASLNTVKLCIPAWETPATVDNSAVLVIDDSTSGLSNSRFEKDGTVDWGETDNFGYGSTCESGDHPLGNGLFYLDSVESERDSNYARWWFKIGRGGSHAFSVFIPGGPAAKARNAKYALLQNGRRELRTWTVDQSAHDNELVYLGKKWLARGWYCIELTNASGSEGEKVVFDSVMVEGAGIDYR